jgi:hypothetical protein
MSAISFSILTSLVLGSSMEVIVTRAVDMPPGRTEEIVARVCDVLAANGIVGVGDPKDALARLRAAGVADPTSCAAKRPCVAKLGEVLQTATVVSIDVGRVGDLLAVGLEAIEVDTGRRLVTHVASFAADSSSAGLVTQVEQFAERLRPELPKASPPPPLVPIEAAADSPRLQSVAPGQAKPAKVDLKLVKWGVAGVAAASGVSAIVVASLGASAAAQLNGSRFESPAGAASRLTRPEADKLAASANSNLSVALGLAIGSAVMTGVAAVVWGLAP